MNINIEWGLPNEKVDVYQAAGAGTCHPMHHAGCVSAGGRTEQCGFLSLDDGPVRTVMGLRSKDRGGRRVPLFRRPVVLVCLPPSLYAGDVKGNHQCTV